jgi:hypothetical protein
LEDSARDEVSENEKAVRAKLVKQFKEHHQKIVEEQREKLRKAYEVRLSWTRVSFKLCFVARTSLCFFFPFVVGTREGK